MRPVNCKRAALALGLALAACAAQAAGEKSAAAPPPAAKDPAKPPAADPPESPEMAAGRKLYETKCGKCHDAYPPGVDEMAWKRTLWKMQHKARLTDDQYDQLTAYARGVREARQARMAKAAGRK